MNTNTNLTKSVSNERETSAINGWAMLAINLGLLLGAAVWLVCIIVGEARHPGASSLWWLLPAILLELLAVVLLCGHFTLQPNEARVLILFGAYTGTVRASGFWWANPFYARSRGKIPLPPGSVSPEAVKAAAAKGMGSGSFLYRSLSSKISLRARNFNSERLKVNDKR